MSLIDDMRPYIPEDSKIICEHCFIYSPWRDRVAMYEGFVRSIGRRDDSAYFVNRTKRLSCARAAGEVYNSMVWLTERDDDRARKLLITHEEVQIGLIQKRIDNHRAKINTLKEGPIYFYTTEREKK
jgi:hypothetical protein